MGKEETIPFAQGFTIRIRSLRVCFGAWGDRSHQRHTKPERRLERHTQGLVPYIWNFDRLRRSYAEFTARLRRISRPRNRSISAINSTAALSAVPLSGQTQPNYIGPADFSNIDILISFVQPADEVGIGLLAGSSNSFMLTARNAANAILGSYVVSVPSDGVEAFNGYFAIQDSGFTIKSLEISGNGGIDDLQFHKTGAPEPAGLALIGSGLVFLAGLGKFRRKR